MKRKAEIIYVTREGETKLPAFSVSISVPDELNAIQLTQVYAHEFKKFDIKSSVEKGERVVKYDSREKYEEAIRISGKITIEGCNQGKLAIVNERLNEIYIYETEQEISEIEDIAQLKQVNPVFYHKKTYHKQAIREVSWSYIESE